MKTESSFTSAPTEYAWLYDGEGYYQFSHIGIGPYESEDMILADDRACLQKKGKTPSVDDLTLRGPVENVTCVLGTDFDATRPQFDPTSLESYNSGC